MTFSLTDFKRRRALQRLLGKLMFWGGLLLLLAGVTGALPRPLRGKRAMWWLIVVGVGAWSWISSRRLPLEETVEIAKDPKYFGELRVTELTSELNVSLENAEDILMALVKKGYARVEQRGETRVWVFPDIKSAFPAVRRTVASRQSDGAGSPKEQGDRT